MIAIDAVRARAAAPHRPVIAGSRRPPRPVRSGPAGCGSGARCPRIAETPAPPEAEAAQRDNAERDRRAENLKRVQDALAASNGQRAQFEAEIAAIGTDRSKLDSALLDAGRQAQATEDRLSRLEERLKAMSESEAAIRHSLQARRGVVAEILAALQRMGRRPPPAVLVSPEDVLAAIRTSMLLGAVVPELRGEVDTLAADLARNDPPARPDRTGQGRSHERPHRLGRGSASASKPW